MTKIMIKKSLRAYITRRQLKFGILPNRKMVRLFLLQIFKHQIDRVLKILVIFTDFHSVDEFDERGKVLFLLRCLIVDIADESTVKQDFCL